MSNTVEITLSGVTQVLPTVRPERGVWVHPTTGKVMSSWAPAKSAREAERRDTRASGIIATSGLGPAGRAYAHEMFEAGDCGYKSAVAQAWEIFPNGE